MPGWIVPFSPKPPPTCLIPSSLPDRPDRRTVSHPYGAVPLPALRGTFPTGKQNYRYGPISLDRVGSRKGAKGNKGAKVAELLLVGSGFERGLPVKGRFDEVKQLGSSVSILVDHVVVAIGELE